MNKSLLMLLAVAIMGSNMLVAKAPEKKNNGWCDFTRCDKKVAAPRCGCKAQRSNKENKERKTTRECGCCSNKKVTRL